MPVHPNDIVLAPQRLDLAAMKMHHFVTTNSSAENLVYRMLFTDGEERNVPLPQPALFGISRRPLLNSKERVDEHLRWVEFHGHFNPQPQENEEEVHDNVEHYPEAPSSSYHDEDASSSYHGDIASWDPWN